MCKLSVNLVVVAAALISMATICQAREQHLMVKLTGEPEEKKSTWTSITESVSSGFKKVSDTISKPFGSKDEEQETDGAPDPTRIATPAEPSADLHVALARSLEDRNMLDKAALQYQEALKMSPTHLTAMLAYGRLLDRRGRFAEAVQWYHRAVKAHPGDTRPLNHLALCLASHNLLTEAASAMEKAIRLEPKRAAHRNNIAVILVEQGNNQAAFSHLRMVHDEATAYYNLGYLLQKREDHAAALRHFEMALSRNPNLDDARTWVNHLRRSRPELGPAAARMARRTDPRAVAQPPRADEQRFARPAPQDVPQQSHPTPPFDPRTWTPPSQTQPTPNTPTRSQAVQPWETQGLQQPAHATAPEIQTNPLRMSSPWPRTGDRVPPPGYRRPTPADTRQSAPPQGQLPAVQGQPTDATPTAPPAARQPIGAPINDRWGSLSQQATSTPLANSAPVPAPQQSPPTSSHGTQRANVVYPLPPVDDTGYAR